MTRVWKFVSKHFDAYVTNKKKVPSLPEMDRSIDLAVTKTVSV
jgi:hypothetical protein